MILLVWLLAAIKSWRRKGIRQAPIRMSNQNFGALKASEIPGRKAREMATVPPTIIKIKIEGAVRRALLPVSAFFLVSILNGSGFLAG